MGGAPHMATWLIGAVALLLVSILGGALLMAVKKPFAEEIGYQIDRFPDRLLLFVALRFFPEDERERRYDQWAEDYQELSDTYENRTLVRIIKCTRFSLSLVVNSGAIRRAAAQNSAKSTDYRRLRVADRIMNSIMVLVGGGGTIYAITSGDSIWNIASYAAVLLSGLGFVVASRQMFHARKAMQAAKNTDTDPN